MYELINELLSKLPVDMDGEAKLQPEVICSKSQMMVQSWMREQSIMFHHFVAKLLFLCKWA